jgi:pimeloyl-ACP methyl ester carboxylesterase
MMKVVTGERPRESSGRSEQPLYFSSGDHRLFGWLHRTVGRNASLGVVICNPFGYESICSHRSVRTFAEAAAAAGAPTLRFDYVGTGNSDDLEPGAEQISAWTDDVVAAVCELQRATGVERVCLLGFRLGAMLATLAAARCEAARALILVAPVISGPRYLRELRTVHLAASQRAVVAPMVAVSSEGDAAECTFEVSGFSLSHATIEALTAVDMMSMTAAPAQRMLIIDRNDLPAARRWNELMGQLGAHTEYLSLPGIVEMIWTAPHFATVPQSMISVMGSWLAPLTQSAFATHEQTGAHASGGSTFTRRQRVADQALTVLRFPDLPGPQAAMSERPVFFGPGETLFGIVTQPRSGEDPRRGVIFVNDGATYHIGANRINVALARQWARRGYVALRMDLSGLGESAPRPGRPINDVFPPSALDDIRAGIDLIREQFGAADITLVGLCSGAYHALRAAVAELDTDQILLINPQNFFWKEGMSISDVQLIEILSGPGRYRERMLSTKSWRKVLTGRADVRRIAWVHVRHAWFTCTSWLRNLARRLNIRVSQDLGRELEDVTRRGVQVTFVFSRGEVGIELLKMQAGSSVQRVGDRCRVHIIDGADHIFSQSVPRQRLEDVLSEELFARRPDTQIAVARMAAASGG